MTIDKKLLEAATGEHRSNPDQRRLYLGTLAERVVLSITLADAADPNIQAAFTDILRTLLRQYRPLQMKLSASLNQQTCLTYLKIANEQGVTGTVVDETGARSPYGLIIHGQEAINQTDTDIQTNFSHLLAPQKPDQPSQHFWQKWFS